MWSGAPSLSSSVQSLMSPWTVWQLLAPLVQGESRPWLRSLLTPPPPAGRQESPAGPGWSVAEEGTGSF